MQFYTGKVAVEYRVVSSQDEINTGEISINDRTLVNVSDNPALADPHVQNQLSEGQVLAGKYKIVEYIGAGGMSVVYKARDQVLSRDVAIKMLSASRVADEKSVRRFHQEGTALGRLNHQNIVSVYDVGLTESGEPFLVMDFAKGKTLTELVSFSGRCSPLRALHLINNVLDALVHAHEKGVVHRDLKPGNIIVSNPGEENEFARVFDFGIAKLMPGADTTSSELTQTGEIFGSPLYMSPEQCLGKALDGRSDIYSVGCILFELLVGHPPHQAETSVETIIKHVQDQAKSLKESCPGARFDDGLENIVRKALCKDPADRFQTAKEIKDAVEQLLCASNSSRLESTQRQKLFGLFEKDSLTLGIVGGLCFLGIILIGILVWSTVSSFSQRNKPLRTEMNSGMMRYAVDEAQKITERENLGANELDQSFHFPDGIASLSYQDIDDTVVGKLTNTTGISKIDINHSRVTASKLLLSYFSRLEATSVNMAGSKFDLEFLRVLSRMKTLRVLDISDLEEPLTEAQMELICDVPTLQELWLHRSIESDEALRPIFKLKNLLTLDLSKCKVTDKAMEYVGQCQALLRLDLNDARVSGKGLRILSGLRKLTSLDIANNRLSDKDVDGICALSGLENLNLEGNNITDAGLMNLTKLKKLNVLRLEGCPKITHSGISKFLVVLPHCLVKR